MLCKYYFENVIQKVFQSPIAKQYFIGAFLINMCCCCYGSQTLIYFGCDEMNGKLSMQGYFDLEVAVCVWPRHEQFRPTMSPSMQLTICCHCLIHHPLQYPSSLPPLLDPSLALPLPDPLLPYPLLPPLPYPSPPLPPLLTAVSIIATTAITIAAVLLLYQPPPTTTTAATAISITTTTASIAATTATIGFYLVAH